MSASVVAVGQPAGERRRVRPYLLWLQRSRDRWKDRAGAARAEVRSLRRQLARVTAGRDRWRLQALRSRRQLRDAREEAEKNARRS